jgi:hypothetical protein
MRQQADPAVAQPSGSRQAEDFQPGEDAASGPPPRHPATAGWPPTPPNWPLLHETSSMIRIDPLIRRVRSASAAATIAWIDADPTEQSVSGE